MNLPELLKLKYPNISFLDDVKLRDVGNGPEIYEWNLEAPLPTKKELANWAIEFDLKYRQNKAVEKRQYPSIGDQLDMIYRDKLDNTSVWVDAITAVKTAHPKPLE